MLLIVSDRPGARPGGREQYAADLLRYLAVHAPGVRIERDAHERRRRRAEAPEVRVLALSPRAGATHYQLHGGLLASAFAAERESMTSSLRRAFFNPALRVNRRRQQAMSEEAALVGGATALMAFSTAVAGELIDRGVSPDRVRVERPGVDLRRFRPRPSRHPASNGGAPIRLAFVAHNFTLKGLPAAIAALARVRRGGVDATLAIAGGGDADLAARWARDHHVHDHVSILGALDQEQVATLCSGSDALVHPTFYDPFPRVIVEALACGCPVVTTARCGAAEIITPGREGFVVPDPGDRDAVAEAIGTLADADRRRAMQCHAAALGARFDDRAHFRKVGAWLGLDDPSR
jgi:glycosyltransferase involved in cell wall biosynthesis